MAHMGGSSCTDFTPVIVHDVAPAVNRNEGIRVRPNADCIADPARTEIDDSPLMYSRACGRY